MKKIKIAVCLLGIFLSSVYSTDLNERLNKAHSYISKIDNSLKEYEKVELYGEEYMDHTTDGGASLTAYFKGDSLIKMKEWVGISLGHYEYDYYYLADKLYAVSINFYMFRWDNELEKFDMTEEKISFGNLHLMQGVYEKIKINDDGPWTESNEMNENQYREHAEELLGKVLEKRQR